MFMSSYFCSQIGWEFLRMWVRQSVITGQGQCTCCPDGSHHTYACIGTVLWFHGSTDTVSRFDSTLTDAMRSTAVFASRASSLCTYHVLPVRLPVCFPSRFTCLFTLPFWTVNSSMLIILFYAYLLQLICRLIIPGLMTRLPLTPVCTCISQSDIYTVGDEDSFLIFNLLCNHPTSATCEIPHTLSHPF